MDVVVVMVRVLGGNVGDGESIGREVMWVEVRGGGLPLG